MSSCECDEAFRECLENDTSTLSGNASCSIGTYYFDVDLGPPCFDLKNGIAITREQRIKFECDLPEFDDSNDDPFDNDFFSDENGWFDDDEDSSDQQKK